MQLIEKKKEKFGFSPEKKFWMKKFWKIQYWNRDAKL